MLDRVRDSRNTAKSGIADMRRMAPQRKLQKVSESCLFRHWDRLAFKLRIHHRGSVDKEVARWKKN